MSDYQNLFAALAKAQGEMDALIASSTANIKSDKAAYSYKYADLADVLRVALKTLSKHGLGIVQIPEVVYDSNTTIVSIAATLFHASGEFMPIAPLPLRVRPNATAQEVGSAITYARRYQLQSVLGLAADDDDGAAATKGANDRQQQRKPQPAAQYRQPISQEPPPADDDFMLPVEAATTSEQPAQAVQIARHPDTLQLEVAQRTSNDNGSGYPSTWANPLDAQAWAVQQGYCANEHEARNSWANSVKECKGYSQRNKAEVFLNFYEKHAQRQGEPVGK